jgi:hypothetical protein
MAQHASWVSYSGGARISLAVILLVAAAAVAGAGAQLPRSIRLPRPGRITTYVMVTAWVVVIFAFLSVLSALTQQANQGHPGRVRLTGPIAPVTDTAVAVTFIVILVLGRSDKGPVRLWGAVIGALAAPMVFEFPFDFIVMTRITRAPTAHLVAFFVPLFLIEIITLALLATSPMVRPRRATFFCFASILVVFAIWGLFGFGYPGTPLNYSLNVVSKLLAFATTLTLFWPARNPSAGAGTEAGPEDRPGTEALPETEPLGKGAQLGPLLGRVRAGRADHQPGDPLGGQGGGLLH